MDIKEILEKVQRGDLRVDEAEASIRSGSVADMGFAKLDLDRRQRQGFPEVIQTESAPRAV